MNVTIQGITVSYYPDYTPTSQLWKVHLRDAFRPVTIAGTECFIKRFASKPRAWSFMVANKGKKQTGLPLIYEANSAKEDGKMVYYLILEKIEGETLHDLLRSKSGGKASVSLMGRALVTGLRTVHEQGFWHADFCAKNIMVSTSGRQFVMIDLDSLEPVAISPTTMPNEPGYLPDQELAVYALNYIQSYVEPSFKGISAIHGPALNLLQMVFLLDKLTYFTEVLKPKGTKFRDFTAFQELPHLIHRCLGAYTDRLVKRILDQSADSEMVITQPIFFLNELPDAKSAAIPPPPPQLAHPPATLLFFQASRYAVLPGQSTRLSWNVSGVKILKISNLGVFPAEGSYPVAHTAALVGEQVYTLTADGGKISETIKVDFFISPPLAAASLQIPAVNQAHYASIVSFQASTYFLKEGEQTVLSWKVVGTGTIYISNIGTVPSSGAKSFDAEAFNGPTQFELTAGSPAVKQSFVVVFPTSASKPPASPSPQPAAAAALIYFRSSSYSVLAGQAATLSWEVSGAIGVHISHIGSQPAKGHHTIQHSSGIIGEQQYTLTVGSTSIKKDIRIRFLPALISVSSPQVIKSVPALKPAPARNPTRNPVPTLPTATQSNSVTINSFVADRHSLIKGGRTKISWDVRGASHAHISNIGIVSSKGFKTFNSKAFKGKVEFVLTAGIPAVKRSFFIDFPAAPAVSVVHAAQVVPAVPVTSANLPFSQSLAQVAVGPPPAKAQVLPVKSNRVAWLGILGLIILMGVGWAYSGATFSPNQERGLQQFDRGDYDSSFVNLAAFRDDTSHHFATQYNLAHMYDDGKGTAVNNALAVQLYGECLRSTVPEVVSKSLYALGWCYLLGEGCTRDSTLAKNYFSVAASRYNSFKAKAQLERLKQGAWRVASAPGALPPTPAGDTIAFQPRVRAVSDAAVNVQVKRVITYKNSTRIDFICRENAEQGREIFINPPGHAEAMHIECAGKTYYLLKTEGIANFAVNPSTAYPSEPIYFSAYFQKIPWNVSTIDVIEGEKRGLTFYGIQIVK